VPSGGDVSPDRGLVRFPTFRDEAGMHIDLDDLALLRHLADSTVSTVTVLSPRPLLYPPNAGLSSAVENRRAAAGPLVNIRGSRCGRCVRSSVTVIAASPARSGPAMRESVRPAWFSS
jgi:hypothetical protein